MKYKLIAVDIDGTLLNSRGELTENTKSAILRAIEKGVKFVVSTGRPISGVEWLADMLPIDMPFITQNGAVTIMCKSKRKLAEYTLSGELALEAVQLGRSRGAEVIAWVDGSLYLSGYNDRSNAYINISNYSSNLTNNMEELVKNGATKILWYDSADKNLIHQRDMQEHFKGRLNCHISQPVLLEFVDIHASKALALETICREFGIDRLETIAVGDGYNDLSMIEYAGLGVSMANAPDVVKEKADLIALSNDDDGVAGLINRYFLEDVQ